jgi:hypothetical protein
MGLFDGLLESYAQSYEHQFQEERDQVHKRFTGVEELVTKQYKCLDKRADSIISELDVIKVRILQQEERNKQQIDEILKYLQAQPAAAPAQATPVQLQPVEEKKKCIINKKRKLSKTLADRLASSDQADSTQGALDGILEDSAHTESSDLLDPLL